MLDYIVRVTRGSPGSFSTQIYLQSHMEAIHITCLAAARR